MTDLEMVRKCAERMGLFFDLPIQKSDFPKPHDKAARFIYAEMMSAKKEAYNPLHDDAQAMALVKKFGLHVFIHSIKLQWCAGSQRIGENRYIKVMSPDLNRAIVECVAQLP